MKIKYLQSRGGKGFVINPGDEATVSTEKGNRLVGLGFAEEVKSKRKEVEVVTTEVKKTTRTRKKRKK